MSVKDTPRFIISLLTTVRCYGTFENISVNCISKCCTNHNCNTSQRVVKCYAELYDR